MSLNKCYELLGLSPDASPEESKAAYRDLAKVWHPDRFLHDPRLQEKAQEKLKEINEAYEQLRSGQARPTPPSPKPFDQRASSTNVSVAQGISWPLVLGSVLIFAVAFFAAYRFLLRASEQEDQSLMAIEQSEPEPDSVSQSPEKRESASANEPSNGTDRIKAKSQREESANQSSIQANAATVPATSTVTVEIDPYTRMIARSDCPVKSTMTYASGNEPTKRCNALHTTKKSSQSDGLKSVAKRLVSPGKWFGEEAKSDAGKRADPKSP